VANAAGFLFGRFRSTHGRPHLMEDGNGMNRDFTIEATALFVRFAERHGLSYEIDNDAPVEVLWTFPAQSNLAHPIVLGLQNGDELNFGVVDFWSYFFPFEKVAEQFERIINAWIVGDARVAITGRRARLLQLWEAEKWRTVYGANRLLPLLRSPSQTVENRPLLGLRD
jgi:hypothetical protein